MLTSHLKRLGLLLLTSLIHQAGYSSDNLFEAAAALSPARQQVEELVKNLHNKFKPSILENLDDFAYQQALTINNHSLDITLKKNKQPSKISIHLECKTHGVALTDTFAYTRGPYTHTARLNDPQFRLAQALALFIEHTEQQGD